MFASSSKWNVTRTGCDHVCFLIRNLGLRSEMDFWITSYPKTGSTWAARLLNQNPTREKACWHPQRICQVVSWFQSSPLHLWQRCDIWSPTCTRMLGSVLFIIESNLKLNIQKHRKESAEFKNVFTPSQIGPEKKNALPTSRRPRVKRSQPASRQSLKLQKVRIFLKLSLSLSQLCSFTFEPLAVQPSEFGS